MPKPRNNESRDEFMDRCMGDPEAVSSFPDANQRYAFCNSQWSNRKTAMDRIKQLQQDKETKMLTGQIINKND